MQHFNLGDERVVQNRTSFNEKGEFRCTQNKMTSKCNAVTSTSYQKLHKIENVNENGIINEVIDEIDDHHHYNVNDVVNEEDEDEIFIELKSESGRDSPCINSSEVRTPSRRKRSVLKRSGESKPRAGCQKRVSFSSVSSDRKRRVSNAMDCFTYMRIGTEFTKVRAVGRQYQRYYQLDETMEFLHWQPSSKKPEKAILPIDVLYEVRLGRNTTTFKEQGATYSEDCCFSIVFGSDYETVDLVAKTSDEANIWVTGLRLLIAQKTGCPDSRRCPDSSTEEEKDTSPPEDEGDLREKWLRKEFKSVCSENCNVIDEHIVHTLLKKLWVNTPSQVVKQKFQEAAINSSCGNPNKIDEDDFCQFFIDLTTRQEIYFVLVRYSTNGLYLTADDLLVFLETEQGVTWATKEYTTEIINRCEPSEEGRKRQILGLDGFTKYFSEKDCNIFNPEHESVCEDMKKPLSHYFIASSHNSYPLDNQVKGFSSFEGYIDALRSGCRCLELDIWDGSEGVPIVFHGHSQTSQILLYDVLEAINEFAFTTSDYPLILSVENHCSPKQQEVMTEYLQSIFRDSLYRSPADENSSQLPILESLKGKIIIKNKRLPRQSAFSTSEITEVENEDDMVLKPLQLKTENPAGTDNVGFQKPAIDPSQRKTSRSMSMGGDANALTVSALKLGPELAELVNLCKCVHFGTFQQNYEKQKHWDICSIGESTARRLCQICPEEFVSYNKRFLSRIYPGSQRVDCSNFNPVEFWNCGSQLVALNYQYPGLAMDLNRGRFFKNGQCGYTLKPAVMREEVSNFSPAMKNEVPGVNPLTLQVKIISGYQLPKPRGSTSKGDSLDPYVMVELYGLASDCHYERIRTVPHNGYNPIFDETFEFRIILPELALLRFVVLDDDHIGDCFIGQYTACVDCIREGYRTVYLLSSLGENLAPASLFVHISFIRESEMTAKMKGFSISKSLKKKEYTSLKTLGMKVIDDTFKLSAQPLRDATNLRENFQSTLNVFKDCCDLSPRANIKQCIRILATRIATCNSKITIDINSQIPCIVQDGEPTSVLHKITEAFEAFLRESSVLLLQAEDVYEKLNHGRRSALEWHGDLQKKCAQEGLNERRSHKVIDSFSWNIKVLSGEANLLNTAKVHCEEYMKQIKDVARSCNLVRNEEKR